MNDTNDTMWQTLEEKMMQLISENERLHKENVTLKFEREQHSKRLFNLISLMDSVNTMDGSVSTGTMAAQQQPILVQN